MSIYNIVLVKTTAIAVVFLFDETESKLLFKSLHWSFESFIANFVINFSILIYLLIMVLLFKINKK